jgi:hypothetical protein
VLSYGPDEAATEAVRAEQAQIQSWQAGYAECRDYYWDELESR